MIPLRRLLVVQSHAELPYPEGTACAAVLRATTAGAGAGTWIFRGMAVGATVKLLGSVAFLFPNSLELPLGVLPKAVVALELAPALVAIGYILGYRESGVLVAGSIVSAFALTPLIAWLGASLTTPLFPETQKLVGAMSAGEIWSRYVRYIGAGAVAAAGILTVARNLPTMAGAFGAVLRGVRARQGGDTGARSVADSRPASAAAGTVADIGITAPNPDADPLRSGAACPGPRTLR